LLYGVSAAYGLNYVAWQNCYDLWMPQIITESRPDAAQQHKLPFPAPTVTFGAPLYMVSAPVDLQSALLFDQPWFSHEIESPSRHYFLQLGAKPPIEIPAEVSERGLPSSIWCVKTLTDAFVFASWPAEMPVESRRAVAAIVKKAAQGLASGSYELMIYR